MKKLLVLALLASLAGCGPERIYTFVDHDGTKATISHLFVADNGHLRGIITLSGPRNETSQIADDEYTCTVINSENWSCNGFLAQKWVLTEGTLTRVGGFDGQTLLGTFTTSWTL